MLQKFRGRSEQGTDLERELKSLEKQASKAALGSEAQFFNRAGDLCVSARQQPRALGYYGRAIDSFLESARWDAAAAVCRKLLRITPDAVRARCTLAWLSIGKGHFTDAQREIMEYVVAAKSARQESLAARQLQLMGEATHSPELRSLLADFLLDLGNLAGADQIYGAIYADQNQATGQAAEDAEERWAKVLRAALMRPEELQAPQG